MGDDRVGGHNHTWVIGEGFPKKIKPRLGVAGWVAISPAQRLPLAILDGLSQQQPPSPRKAHTGALSTLRLLPLTHRGSPFEAEQNPSLSPNGCAPCHHPRIWTPGSTVFSSPQLICPCIMKKATTEQFLCRWQVPLDMAWHGLQSGEGRKKNWHCDRVTPECWGKQALAARYSRLGSGAHSPVVSCGADQLGLLIIFVHTISPFLGTVPVLLCKFSFSLNFLLAKLGVIAVTRGRQKCKAHPLLYLKVSRIVPAYFPLPSPNSMVEVHKRPGRTASQLLIVLKSTASSSSSDILFQCHHTIFCHFRIL